ncbi:WD40 repeat-like protein, partial [Ceratobasidium sp. AG-I]
DTILSLVFSPDGRRLVSGSWSFTVSVWDMESDTPTAHLLLGHASQVTSVAFSHDGSLIASGSADDTVRIWNITNNAVPVEAFLNYLSSASSSDPARIISQVDTKYFDPANLTLSTSHLARRLTDGGWVSLSEGSALLWLPPDYRVVDDSIVQISARHLPRCLIDFSKFVHGDSWTSVAGDSVCRYPLAD